MTVVSMTGFGSASRAWSDAGDGGIGTARVDVEVRSVNARFLEVKVRQPFGPRLEQKIRTSVEKRLGRGRVEVAVFIRRPRQETDLDDADALGTFGVDAARVEAALRAAEAVAALGQRSSVELRPFSSLELLRFVTTSARAGADTHPEAPDFLDDLLHDALGQLCTFRETEGAALQQALSGLADDLEQNVRALEAECPGEQARLQQRLSDRVADLCARVEVSPPPPERLAHEVAILVAKGDIEEELARIDSHLGQLRTTLAAPAAKGQGKTLDFVTQELLRETTTIGSKITSHEGSRIVIEAKSTIERIREQVANVE